jgi:hypothetical protein
MDTKTPDPAPDERERIAVIRRNAENGHGASPGQTLFVLDSLAASAAEVERLRTAIEPVADWYQSDEDHAPPLPTILDAIVQDLQTDRADCLRMAAALRRLRDAGNADKQVESWMREIIDVYEFLTAPPPPVPPRPPATRPRRQATLCS